MRYRKALERNGSKGALSDQTWSQHALPVNSGPLTLISRRGAPLAGKDDIELAEQVLWSRFKLAMKRAEKASARSLIPSSGLEILRQFGISEADLTFLLDIIDDLIIPIGSAHGDAHQDNFIRIGSEIKLIDWTGFDEESSPLFDLLYWYSDKHRRKEESLGNPQKSLHDQILSIPSGWTDLAPIYPNIEQLQVYFVLMRVIIKFRVKRKPLKAKNFRISAPVKSLVEKLKKQQK